MVNHAPYGLISLTAKGQTKAQEVWRRHQVIRRFLLEVLKVSPAVADKDACMIEHVISPETLLGMIDCLREEHSHPIKTASRVPLGFLMPGQKARIVKIQGKNSPVKLGILDMGLVPGVEVEAEGL